MKVTIALDAMGGDHAPFSVLTGAETFLKRHATNPSKIHFLVFGDEHHISPLWKQVPHLQKVSTFTHTNEVIQSDLKATFALRNLKKASMRLAIEAVANGQAQAVISGGNTGAYAALTKILLKMIQGIDRPSLPALLPTPQGSTILLDAGATLTQDPDQLLQFALMGESLAQCLLEKKAPRIGILNIGTESLKGHAYLQDLALRLQDYPRLNFKGFVEGTDILKGTVDVIVTDGFTGNMALKTIEGTVNFVSQVLRTSLKSSWRSRIGAYLATPGFKNVRKCLDPRYYNGTLFLGLKSLAIKSHGSMDALGYSYAIEVAVNLAQRGLIKSIEKRIEQRELAVA